MYAFHFLSLSLLNVRQRGQPQNAQIKQHRLYAFVSSAASTAAVVTPLRPSGASKRPLQLLGSGTSIATPRPFSLSTLDAKGKQAFS